MSKALRLLSTLVLIAVSGNALALLVVGPFRQNQILKAVIFRHESASAAMLREDLELVRTGEHWDPYLTGWKELTEARILRKLGRRQEALLVYRSALTRRLPNEYWVEVGLFEMELGDVGNAEKRLRTAAELGVDLREHISDPELRRQVRGWIK